MKHLIRLFILSLLISFWLPALSADAKNDPLSGPIWLSSGNEDQPGQIPQTNVSAPQKNALDITISFSGVWAEQQTNDGQNFTQLWHPEYGNYREPGEPALPGTTFNVLIPDGVTIEIIHSKISSKKINLTDFNLPKMIVPAQIQATKSEPPPPWTQPDPLKYAQSTPNPENWYALNPILKMRDYTILPIWVNPVRYQPDKGEVELLQQIELRLKWNLEKMDITQSGMKGDSPSFDRLISQLVINPPELPAYDTKSTIGEGYLIITPDEFVEALQPFVEMKENQGYVVKVKIFDEYSETSDDIKTFIKNEYTNANPCPTYILLVGDTQTDVSTPLLPATNGSITGRKTDLYYTTMDEPVNDIPDYGPDIHIGRLPVRTAEEASTVINKLIAYTTGGYQSWQSNASFIATCDTRFFQIAEESHNYVIQNNTAPNNFFGDFPDILMFGGDQLYCRFSSTIESEIISRINIGRSLITYSGHGFQDGWKDGLIDIDKNDIRQLTENNKFSFVASFACQTNDFGAISNPTVFSETWMLQENKGAIAFLGSTSDTIWDQDDILEKSFYDSLFKNVINPLSLREAMFLGLSNVEEKYPGTAIYKAKYYWEAYNLLGDPSQKLWLVPSNRVFLPVIFK